MINCDRLAQEFLSLAHIESPSRKEGKIASYLKKEFQKLGAKCIFDNSALKTGSEVGNLIVKIPGTIKKSPIFFAAHMDTVEPTQNPCISLKNGIFRSDGRTICGADDKSAIAILIEIAKLIKAYNLPHPPLEFVFTTCEEIGLLGAKNLDYSLIESTFGYVLDSEDPDELINRAPEAIRFSLKLLGVAAHAGLCPEKGINAIKLAAEGISRVRIGRIDEETTSNIGIIHGGTATNIVPEVVELLGEIRSHSHDKLEDQWEKIISTFQQVIEENRDDSRDRPAFHFTKEQDYPLMHVPEDTQVVRLACSVAEKLRRKLKITFTGGGSDANIFNGQGLSCVILGTGMQNVHSTEEFLVLEDLVKTAELCLHIIIEAAK